jgi:hypothetical protein
MKTRTARTTAIFRTPFVVNRFGWTSNARLPATGARGSSWWTSSLRRCWHLIMQNNSITEDNMRRLVSGAYARADQGR